MTHEEAKMKEILYCPEGYIFKDADGNIINATKIVLEKNSYEVAKVVDRLRKDITKYIRRFD